MNAPRIRNLIMLLVPNVARRRGKLTALRSFWRLPSKNLKFCFGSPLFPGVWIRGILYAYLTSGVQLPPEN